MGTFKVQVHDRNDDSKIFELQRLVYPNNPVYSNLDTTQRYWQWRYFSSSSIESFVYVVKSEDGNTIAGMRPMSIVPIKVGEKIVRGLWLTAVITHPAYRNKGIFSTLVKHSMQKAQDMGVEFAYTFPNENSYPIYQKIKTWHTIANMPIMIKIINPVRILTKLIKSPFCTDGESCLEKKSPFAGFPLEEKGPQSGCKLSIATDIGHEYNELWSEASKSFSVAIPRHVEYLTWRYLNNPVFSYEIIEARNTHGRLEGYAVIGFQHRNRLKVGLLVDMLCRPESDDVGSLLIKQAVSRLKHQKADIACALVRKSHAYGTLISQLGFLPIPLFFKAMRVNVIGSILNNSIDIQKTIYDFNNWYLTWGDTDNA